MFTYTGNNQKLISAVKAANSSDLLTYLEIEIHRQDHYDMSTVDGIYLAGKFKFFNAIKTANVKVYYPKWRFSKAYGYYSAANPLDIYINGYKLDAIHPVRLVGLLHHEKSHMQNNFDLVEEYHHGTGINRNNPKGKELTFQYSLNRFVNAFYGYKKPKRLSIWQRIMRWF